MPQLCTFPNCQISWDPNVFHANYVHVKNCQFLEIKIFFKSIVSPSKLPNFWGLFYFILFFIFSFWKLCSLAMLLSSEHQKRFPPTKFIGINMALGRSWINYLYTMWWWWMQRSWGDHLFKYRGTLMSTHWMHLTTTKGAPYYCLFSKQTLAFFTHRGGIIQTLWWPEKWNPKPFVIDKGYVR